MNTFAIDPGCFDSRFVALSKSGTVFRKQILGYGDLYVPGIRGGKLHIDQKLISSMVDNFNNKVTPIVQVPKVNGANEHTEDPDRNVGEVVALHQTEKGLFADIDVRTDDASRVGKTLLGASAMFDLNYTDSRTGKPAGPTLLHVAITNRPHVVELEGFQELVATSAHSSKRNVVMLTSASNLKGDHSMLTLDELKEALKDDFDIDVDALQEKATVAEEALALSAKVQTELAGSGLLKLSASQPASTEVMLGAIADAGAKIVELSAKIDSMQEDALKEAASSEVERLILSGHILPKDKEAMLKLRTLNADIFKSLLPEKPLVALSAESGKVVTATQTDQDLVDSEIARLSALAQKSGAPIAV